MFSTVTPSGGTGTRATAKGASSGASALISGSAVVLFAGTISTARGLVCAMIPPEDEDRDSIRKRADPEQAGRSGQASAPEQGANGRGAGMAAHGRLAPAAGLTVN